MHPVDPTGREDQLERRGCQAGSAISTRTRWAAAGARLRCPLINYAGRRRDNREDLAVIGRHLHRVDVVLRAAHDIKRNMQVERELFSVIMGPFFRWRPDSVANLQNTARFHRRNQPAPRPKAIPARSRSAGEKVSSSFGTCVRGRANLGNHACIPPGKNGCRPP
jgi:hypothetical protein